MKVQNITTQPKFQPVTLQITIESEDELNAIKQLTGRNCTVTNFLKEEVDITPEQQHTCSVFLGRIYNEIKSDYETL